MKTIITSIFFTFWSVVAFTQYDIGGKITDQNNDPVPFATIFIEGTFLQTQANFDGGFLLKNLPTGDYQLIIQYVGLKTEERSVTIKDENLFLEITLYPLSYVSEEVIIKATRFQENQGGSYVEINKEDLEKQDYGQDMPFLLNQTPSTVVTSDAGGGVGYTGIRLRGSDPTRINVTINGIPMNDSESHSVYWVDIPDISGSTENVQITRGVGSSTHGGGAFGGSINLLTNSINPKPYAKYSGAVGSFNTWKNSVSFGTGLVNKHWSFDGRISKITSDGFIDRASSDLKSYYLSAGYFTDKTLIKAIVFGGFERTYQAWNGVPQAKYDNDSLALVTHIENNGYSTEEIENLWNSSAQTYNSYTYQDQVDNYNQDHIQLHVSHSLTTRININGALHHTYGRGYFEQYKAGENLSDYNLTPIIATTDSTDQSDLIRRKWLDNDFYGFTGSINYEDDQLELILGGAINQYDGRHFGKVIWAQRAKEDTYDHEFYNNLGTKTDGNVFVKANYALSDKWSVMGDMQFRAINYQTKGYDETRSDVITDTSYTFLNPKFALNYKPNPSTEFYGYIGVANREPIRGDFVDAVDNQVPMPEQLVDYELGATKRYQNLMIQINGYYMDYKNQLINTGAVNDVGDPIRTNVDKSYRTGIELVSGYRINKSFTWQLNATWSKNKIDTYIETLYDYTDDGFGIIETELKNVDIAFSPNIIVGNNIEYSFLKHFNVALFSKYVGQQFLDNTQSDNKKLDDYLVHDLFVNFKKELKSKSELTIGLKVGNLLSEKYASNGYTYSYIYSDMVVENFVYPQAGRNVMLKFGLSF